MSNYDAIRHFVDSWGLIATVGLFLVLVAWPFRPGLRDSNNRAANSIFEEKDQNNG